MRPILYLLSFLALIALGFWAYRENYATQNTLREVRSLQSDIAGLHEAITMQRAEWAYLNRPARLRELANLNYERLGLMPMDASRFGTANDIPFPAAKAFLDDVLPGQMDGADGLVAAAPMDGAE